MNAELKILITGRIKEHRDNLAGWQEGRRCYCARVTPRPTCALCRGTGVQAGTAGYLVPTEADPQERRDIRMRLQIAIDELKWVLANC